MESHYIAYTHRRLHALCSYARQYKVVDYEDDFTRRELGASQERAFGLLTSAAVSAGALGRVWNAIEGAGLKVVGAKMAHLSAADAASVASGVDVPVGEGPVIALQLLGADAAGAWARVTTHLYDAGLAPAGSLAVAIPEHDIRLRDAFFSPSAAGTRLASSHDVVGALQQCACVCILPSAVSAGQAGQVLDELLSGLRSDAAAPLSVTALGMYDLSMKCAEEFLEVYKGVVPEYKVGGRIPRGECSATCPSKKELLMAVSA